MAFKNYSPLALDFKDAPAWMTAMPKETTFQDALQGWQNIDANDLRLEEARRQESTREKIEEGYKQNPQMTMDDLYDFATKASLEQGDIGTAVQMQKQKQYDRYYEQGLVNRSLEESLKRKKLDDTGKEKTKEVTFFDPENMQFHKIPNTPEAKTKAFGLGMIPESKVDYEEIQLNKEKEKKQAEKEAKRQSGVFYKTLDAVSKIAKRQPEPQSQQQIIGTVKRKRQ